LFYQLIFCPTEGDFMQMAIQQIKGIVPALSTVYQHAPLVVMVAIASNQRVQNAAFGVLEVVAETIGRWIGWSSDSTSRPEFDELKNFFPNLNETNPTEVVDKIRELGNKNKALAQTYAHTRETTEYLLESSSIDNDVKTSIIQAGLYPLSAWNLSNPLDTAVSLSKWVNGVRECHTDKVAASIQVKQCKQREGVQKTELFSCRENNENLSQAMGDLRNAKDKEIEKLRNATDKDMERLRQQISDLKAEKAACEVEKQSYKRKYDDCENRGFVKRLFCWVT
jgi:flagellar motor protein MotB